MAVGAVLSLLYVFHARIDPMPIIRLSLLRIATFRTAVGGGSLYRLGVGSYTFLLPMMLQLGFGYTPLQSGLTTFAGAVGALAMKTIAPRVTRRCGFRRLLVANTFVCSAALIAIGWIRPGTPYLLTISLLLVGGFLRSLQFTCINAMAYADIDEPSMSQATSFSSTAQQLALSVGVGVGSQLLNASRAIRHAQNVEVTDFTVAFCVVALVSLLPVLSFRRLAHDAGSSVSGHRLALANEPTTPAPQ
jgi:Na+/melibiose symporter-like transporter